MFDVYEIRKNFPVLLQTVNGHNNAFLDSAASAQKPQVVINAMVEAYAQTYANVHRGSYDLSLTSTAKYDQARKTVQKFVNAQSENEIVFTRNATESINLVAATWAKRNLQKDDEILISQAEHHANLVPWQILRDEIGCKLKIFKIADDGSYLEEEFLKLLTPKTKLVAVTAMSNVLGTVFPVKDIAKAAHQTGAMVLADACQFAVHHKIDVQDLDVDFLAFSGHKTYGPTGIGVLYGKQHLLDNMPPYQFGGDMVSEVTYEKTTFNHAPYKFEAGTPAFVEAIGLGAALNYMMNLGLDNIAAHEKTIQNYLVPQMQAIDGLKLVGTAADKGGVFSFVIDGIHHQDLAFILNQEGVSIRVGHHCAQPVVARMGYEGVARASVGLYTTKEDIDRFIAAIKKAKTFF